MIRGGFKNMNADKIIQCILVVMLKLEKAVNSTIEAVQDKLDRGGYTGTAQDLDDEIQNLKNPDAVLKSVTPTITGLNISAPADSFEWRINQVVFDNTPVLAETLTPASDGFYRKDALLGTNTNTYLIIEGVEGDESVTPPTVFPLGTILLGVIDIFGNTVGGFSINDTSRTYVYGNGGATDYVEVTKLGTTLEIMNATSLTGFTIPAKNIQYGKDYYLRNSTGGVLTLKSATGTNGIRFYFPQGDLVVPVNNNVHLKYLSNGEFGGLGYFTLVGIDYKNKADKTYVNEALDTKVDKVAGKSLISDAEITRLSTVTNQDISGKVDKVAGERLINSAEITKLAGLSNVVTTVKTILSTALATQDIAGFVTYINTLAAPLVVGANEIVEYKTSDTGRVFKLLLRGRSFGVGQPAIVAADVIETTEFLNKDIRLSNYPSTRNDGQLPTNKVLAPDVNGNLKLYTIATAPAPYMDVLIPDSTLPSTTTNLTIKGAFFTPTMTVSIPGQTINYINFVSDNLIRVNVTTGVAEGLFAVTLNNGISATFNNALSIFLGTVYIPTASDYTVISGQSNLTVDGEVSVFANNVSGEVEFFDIPFGQNFRVSAMYRQSPLNTVAGAGVGDTTISLCQSGVKKFAMESYLAVIPSDVGMYVTQASTGFDWPNFRYNSGRGPISNKTDYTIERIGTIFYFKINNVIVYTFTDTLASGSLQIRVKTRFVDIVNLKYIALA